MDRALVGGIDAGQNFEQSRLATAIAAEDTKELAFLDLKRDVFQSEKFLISILAKNIDKGAFERIRLFMRNSKLLEDVFDIDGDLILLVHNFILSLSNVHPYLALCA